MSGYFVGKTTGIKEKSQDAADLSVQNLCLYVTVEKKTGITTISADQLGDRYDGKITYLGLSDIAIDIDGTVWDLEDAIRSGKTSVDEMIALARLDAINGVCTESARSTNGLTQLTYRYPEFYLLYIYDIYETPSQGQHLISKFAICAPSETLSFVYRDDETGKPIDYEDWGLNFEVAAAHDAGITLKCTQHGGQQIGELFVEAYDLYKRNTELGTEEYIEPLTDAVSGERSPNCHIPREDTTEILLDFSQSYGNFSDGTYVAYLTIEDQYDKDEVPPLMRNYYDRQRFDISFTIGS